MTVAEEQALCARIAKGDREARDCLVNANMKFVVAVARHFLGKGVPFEDLVSEGAAGLVTAANLYNPATSNRFISYAVWWVRQSMMMALKNQGGTIRTPPFGQLKRDLKEAEDKALKCSKNAHLVEYAKERIEHCHRLRNPSRLDDLHDAGFDPIDVDADPSASIESRNITRRVDQVLRILDPVDQEILRRYYGLNQGYEENLEEVGSRFGVTRERIRQRKEKGIRKIRHWFAAEANRS